MDRLLYDEDQKRRHLEYEALCKRCGACCGAKEGNPCEHLRKEDNGLYLCDIYEGRFGLRKTTSGEPVLCVPMRDMLHQSWWGRSECAYVRAFKVL